MSGRRIGALVLAAALVAGCGSTVQPGPRLVTDASGGTGPTIPGDGTTAPGATTGAGDGGEVVAGGTGASAGSSGRPGGSGTGAATGASGGATPGVAPAAGVPALTRGITPSTIKVGIPTIKNGEAVLGLLGAAGVSLGNIEIETRALVDDLNKRGGINGRRLEPVFYGVDFGGTNVEASYLAACSYFADDAGAFAVLSLLNPPDSFVSCAAQKRLLLLNNSVAPGDDALIASSRPWYFMPALVALDRYQAPLVDSALRRGTMKRGDEIGVFVLDEPGFRRVADRTLLPLLRDRGLTVAAVERVSTEAGVQNAVLRFRQEGVTHVMFLQSSAIPVLLFMRQAEAQRYRPRYVLSSYDSPGYLIEGNVAPEQLAGISGIGWEPVQDVDPRRWPANDLEQRCFDILTRGGEENRDRDDNLAATLSCEVVWAFEAVAKAAGQALSTATFVSAFSATGRSYRPVTVFATDFSRRIDGVSAFRPLGFAADCSCIRYLGDVEPLP